MMMANVRSRCSSPISSRMNGNFWTVVMMIFLPCLDELPELARALGHRPDRRRTTWANCLMVSRICLSRTVRSVTTMIESKTGCPSFFSSTSWWASQAIELLLPDPAECWIR